MERNNCARRLIVNADDFGRSRSINEAVIRAHKEGILTSASLMVNEPHCDEAVAFARENPRLGVGLHLTLVCGRSALPASIIPHLVDETNSFSDNAVTAGCRYFFSKRVKEQLKAEMSAQFERFFSTGLPLDHVNGHLNIHLHPAVFGILMENADKWRIRHLRLTCDPLRLNARIAKGNWAYRLSHWFIYRILAAVSRGPLRERNIKHSDRVFGLLQNARVDAGFIKALLAALPDGDSELYSHPSLDEFRHEFDGLVDPNTRKLVEQLGIELIRYQDL